eukprot:3684446-Lingulodinium_polyedra.AAC.1
MGFSPFSSMCRSSFISPGPLGPCSAWDAGSMVAQCTKHNNAAMDALRGGRHVPPCTHECMH